MEDKKQTDSELFADRTKEVKQMCHDNEAKNRMYSKILDKATRQKQILTK